MQDNKMPAEAPTPVPEQEPSQMGREIAAAVTLATRVDALGGDPMLTTGVAKGPDNSEVPFTSLKDEVGNRVTVGARMVDGVPKNATIEGVYVKRNSDRTTSTYVAASTSPDSPVALLRHDAEGKSLGHERDNKDMTAREVVSMAARALRASAEARRP